MSDKICTNDGCENLAREKSNFCSKQCSGKHTWKLRMFRKLNNRFYDEMSTKCMYEGCDNVIIDLTNMGTQNKFCSKVCSAKHILKPKK